MSAARVRIGIGGWTYAPWRGTFYPAGLPHRHELAYASKAVSAIEINSTFYRLQSPKVFAQWAAQTPLGFQFALKAPRSVTYRKVLADAGAGIRRFIGSGIAELEDKLGPVLWQFAPTHQFDAKDCAAFLSALPDRIGARPLRHAVEVAHPSFRDAAFSDLLKAHQVALVFGGAEAEATAGFVYARLKHCVAGEPTGYSPAALADIAHAATAWSQDARTPRDTYIFFINGAKERAPAAALALQSLQAENDTHRSQS